MISFNKPFNLERMGNELDDLENSFDIWTLPKLPRTTDVEWNEWTVRSVNLWTERDVSLWADYTLSKERIPLQQKKIYLDRLRGVNGSAVLTFSSSDLPWILFSDLLNRQKNFPIVAGFELPRKEPIKSVARKRPGRPPGEKSKRRQGERTGRLWEFLLKLLRDPQYNPSLVCWEDERQGLFRFVRSEQVAKMWGRLKKNETMTYEKMSRAMRYYKSKAFESTPRRLVYKFGESAIWKDSQQNHIHT